MSENNQTPKDLKNAKSTKAPATKKRTIYSPKGMLELPEWAMADKEHKYRWVSKRRFPRTDGFDPRGWVTVKDPDGKVLEAHDVVLARMPLDEFESMQDYKRDRAKNAMKLVLEGIDNRMDKMRYEVERLGGKLTKTDFTIERKSS